LLVLEKVSVLCVSRFVLVPLCILCGRPVTHRSPNVDLTRPTTGAGRPDRFPSLWHKM